MLLVTGAMMVSGVLLAFVGENTRQWAPPPVPKAWEAPAARLSALQPAAGNASRARRRPADRHDGAAGDARRRPTAAARQAPSITATRSPAPTSASAAPPTTAPTTAPVAATAPAPTSSPSAPGLTGLAAAVTPLARSAPVSISIPAIGVQASVIKLGLQPGGAMQVPPLSHPFLAGWFDLGPAPGQRGTSVIVGHVDAAGVGPAVFYHLGDLLPGQRIYVTLADRRTAVFEVWAAALYPKAGFPLGAVYGYTARPSLRLITCGGVFNPQTGHYLSNIVVYASYLGSA